MRYLFACLLVFAFTTTAHAQSVPLPVPAGAFPAQTAQLGVAPLSNQDWDCQWAFDCESGVPLLHSINGESLGCQAGWFESGVTRAHTKRQIGWAIAGSTFDSQNDAHLAFYDFIDSSENFPDAVPAVNDTPLLSSPTIYGSRLLIYRSPSVSFYLVAAWAANWEVEGFAVFRTKGGQQDRARSHLIQAAAIALAYQEQQSQ